MGGVLDFVKRIHRQFLGMRGARLDEPIVLPRDLAPQVNVFSTPFYKDWAQPQELRSGDGGGGLERDDAARTVLHHAPRPHGRLQR